MAPDTAVCRICYGGKEEETDLGRLISPCKCRGTAKYVHIMCLQAWRAQSAQSKAYFECDLCHYKYNLRRAWWASMLMSNVSAMVFTGLTIYLLAFLLGYFSYPILETLLDPEDIDLLRKGPRILLRRMGVSAKWRRRILPPNGLVEHQLLGTASLGVLGTFRLLYYARTLVRRRGAVSVAAMIIGLIYVGVELYRTVRWLCMWLLRRLAGYVVDDVVDIGDDEDKKTR